MTQIAQISPTVTFMMRLRKIDKAGITPRDFIGLYAIYTHPGCNGNDVTKMVGHEERSGMQSGFHRMIRLGLIEDRRERVSKAVPTVFYITEKGKQLLDEIMAV